MSISIECPKCGSYTWDIIGWTKPFIIQRVRCRTCWYEEFYSEPKDREACPCCEKSKHPSIGEEYPDGDWVYQGRVMKKCPKCRCKLYPIWEEKEQKLKIYCNRCRWSNYI